MGRGPTPALYNVQFLTKRIVAVSAWYSSRLVGVVREILLQSAAGVCGVALVRSWAPPHIKKGT